MIAAPIPKDTQDFQFKHASTQHVYDNLDGIPYACSLIVADGKRGLLYIGHKNKLSVLKYTENNDYQCLTDYDLPYHISKLSISCDFSYLGVTFNLSTAHIYNVSSLSKNYLEILHEVQLSSSSPNVFSYDLRWNPALPGMFCTVASDHSIGCFQIKAEQKSTLRLVALEKIAGLEAMCVAWSPKGKQLVVGCKNGNIVQLKPELKVARTIPGPSPAIGELIAILWLSNYQFCAAYSDVNERRINVLIVNAPKGETIANFICYEDITYGMPDMEGQYFPRYYFDHIPEWNLIIAGSSCSCEIAILGSLDNGTNWEQWQLIDSARAQLPLIRTIETYPVGMTIDKSSTIKLPWGSESALPHPVPILHIFSTSGQIVSYHMVNLLPNCPSICSPPSEPVKVTSKPQSVMPLEITFNSQPGMTSTPRLKQADAVVDKPKPMQNVNLFNSSLMGSNVILTTPTVPPPVAAVKQIIPPAPAPVAHVDLKIPKPQLEKVEVTVQKSEPIRLSPVKEVSTTNSASESTNLDDSICWRAYQEELIHFEKELKAKLEPQVWQVGTEEERHRLINQYAEIDEFWRELRETTNSLSSEIAYLKALLLQSFAWVEETRSRNSANSSNTSRDRHDRSKIQELQRLSVHTHSQFLQAIKALDMQWSDYQSQERSKMKIPSLEFVYQTLQKHAEIIGRLKKIMEQQATKLKALNKGNKISSLNRSIANLSLNSSSLGTPFGLSVNNSIIETRCKIIANNTKSFTREKQSKLREILLNNTPKVIKPIVPTPVQDRLEATLSSLATLSPVTALSKQKIGKLVPDRPVVSKPSQIIGTTATTPIQKTTAPQSPLASLTSIVANIGTLGAETVTPPPPPPPQSKLQPAPFSVSAFPSALTNTPIADKINTSTNMQFSMKPNVTNQMTSIPPPATQPASVTTAFPKVTSISFGTPDQKTSEAVTPVRLTTSESAQKNIFSMKPKDVGNTIQSTQSLFDTNSFASPVSSASSMFKIDQPSTTYQNQISTSLGSSLSFSFKDSLPPVTTSQQSVFSFASPPTITATPKATTTIATTAIAPSENIQTFSFAPKPANPSAVTKPAVSLDLTKIPVGVSANSTEKPASTMSNTNSFATTFGNLSTSTSTLNFGKVSSPPPDVTQSQQENQAPIILPPGTSIEKIGGFTGSPNPTTTSSLLFGGNPTSTSNVFGTSIFGGTSLSSALPQVTPLSSSDKTPVTSTTSMFSTPSTNIFAQNPVTSSSAAPPPAYNNSQFRGMLGDLSKNVRFDQSPQTSEVSTPATTAAPQTVAPSSPFAQAPSSLLSSLNLMKSPATTTATTTSASTGFFSNSSNNSIFGGMTSNTSAPSKLFGGNSASPAAPSSIFGGVSATAATSPTFGSPTTSATSPPSFGSPAAAPTSPSLFGNSNTAATSSPSFGSPATAATSSSLFGGSSTTATSPAPFGGSMFGASSTFGSQPVMPAAAPPIFGSSPTFSSKPVFGGQPSMFGAAKPEFSSPFASSGFGNSPGFGMPPSMSGSPPAFGSTQMDKVFGSPGSSTFESLAGQNTPLTFDSLAQKSPEKPPTFTGGSSFSSWR